MSMHRLRDRSILRYVVALAAMLATIGVLIPLRFLIEPLPAPPFLLTVMIVAWLAGFGPAVIAVVLSAIALDYWFIPPLGAITTTWHEIASVLSFAAVGIGVAWLTATRRQAEDDRVALLAREQASRASAEAANRAKDEFVAVLGHEFRNPLSAIVSAVHLLDRLGPAEERTRHAREVIARQARNITRLVEDLLEVNRIANGKVRLDLQPVELADTVRRCLATLEGRTEGHRVSLEAEETWVTADPVRLEQIVVNLLDNAVKYTPRRGCRPRARDS
jgi:signal transduction histidine kinase